MDIDEIDEDVDGEIKTVIVENVPDYLGYKVSEYGQFYSFKSKGTLVNRLKPIKSHPKASGHKFVILYHDLKGRTRLDAHKLIAKTFIPIEKELKYVNHIDGDLDNDHYTNLKWSDEPEDIDDGEIWKIVADFPKYKACLEGKIKSFQNRIPIIMSTYITEDGYEKVGLRNDTGHHDVNVHRIIANTFIPNPKDLPFVDHIDGRRAYNHVENLRWVTEKENSENKRDDFVPYSRKIMQLDLERNMIAVYKSAVEAAKNLPVGPAAIRKCANGGSKTSAGYIWEYVDDLKPYELEKGEKGLIIVNDFGHRKFDYPYYQITNFGNVINDRGFKLSPAISNGYPMISLRNKGEGEHIRIHILVALFFVKGRSKINCIPNHIDENKENPHYLNLEWTTRSGNGKHSAHNKRPVNMLDRKTGEFIRRFESITEAAIFLGKKERAGDISTCCRGRLKSCMDHGWEYAEK